MAESNEAATNPNFARLDGVGAVTADAFVDAGVTSMTALASMTVDEVVAALEKQGVTATSSKIISQRWLHQAWRLGRAESVDVPPTGGALGDPTTPTALSAERPMSAETPVEPNGWEEHAGFFVYFDRSGRDRDRWRTRVWDTTTMAEHHLDGVAPGPWVTFILGRADLPAPSRGLSDVAFTVDEAEIEELDDAAGKQRWLRTALRVRLGDDAGLEAALGAALLDACCNFATSRASSSAE